MTSIELNEFLEDNNHIEHREGDDEILFRNTRLPWYQADHNRATAIKIEKLGELTTKELLHEVNKGLMVEGITRVTGYMTKTSSWNPGKLGELKDRSKHNVR